MDGTKEKLMFTHVWEDPDLESSVLKSFKNNNKATKMLMVCSGGDTLIHLICNNLDDINRLNLTIDVVDNNNLQLSVCAFKILLMHYLQFNDNGSNEYSKIMYSMQEKSNNEDIINIINTLINEYKDIEWSSYLKIWLDPQFENILINGLLKHGELETTFKNLIDSQMDFNTEFDHDLLSVRFGNAAINLSEKTTFSDRFRDIYNIYVKKYGNNLEQNHFFYRMVKGYEQELIITDLINKMKNVTHYDLKRINFISQDMQSYVSTCNNNNIYYDIIQTSNITDWLNSQTNVEHFIQLIMSNLNNRGITIWRSLNGDYDLIDVLNGLTEKTINTININIPFDDKSYFYKSSIITRKLQMIYEENETRHHPYFSKLNCCTDTANIINVTGRSIIRFTPEEFLKSQIPFYHAVENWVKVLAHLRDKIKMISESDSRTIESIKIIQENIDDESEVTDEKLSHANTFKMYLEGWKEKTNVECVNIPDQPESHVAEFNDALHNMINNKPFDYVCGCLGEIEYMYISISKIIKEFSDMHNVNQPHYTLHEIMDYKHSTELFETAILLSDQQIEKSVNILDGAEFGRQIFSKLYMEMFESI